MTIVLSPGAEVVADVPHVPATIITAPQPPVLVPAPEHPPVAWVDPDTLPVVVPAPVPPTSTVVVPVVGPPGSPGPAGGHVFEYQMPTAQTTAVIDHDLGRDPIAVQVFDDAQLCSEFGVVFTVPGQQVTIGFDVSVAAFIRLI